ncbi:MAG: cytochrome c [Roseiflexaceae bacterium]
MATITTKARSPISRIMRWLGLLFAGLLGLLLILSASIYILSELRVQRIYTTTPAPIRIETSIASIQRGQHLVTSVMACVDCHGTDLAGKIVVDDPAIGRAVAANLTTGEGGIGRQFSDADFVRAIRHGVKPDRHSLLVMPVDDYTALSEADMAAIIAYIRSIPAVDNELPNSQIGPLGRILLVIGQANLLSAETVPQHGGFPEAIPIGPTVDYGRYLARTSGCMGCHGATLSGGPIPGGPPGFPIPPNITPAGAIQGWTDEQLRHAIREGTRPDGSQLNSFMPYQYYAGMTEEEIQAIIAYLRQVPAKPYGGR